MSDRCRRAAVALAVLAPLLLALLPRPLAAQRGWSVDAGASRVRLGDSLTLDARALTVASRHAGARHSLESALTVALLDGSAWSLQGQLGLGRRLTERRGWTPELFGSVGGSTHRDGATSSAALAGARAHRGGSTGGLWLGAGAGAVHDGVGRRSLGALEAGAWAQRGPLFLVGTATPTLVEGGVRFADAVGTLRWTTRLAELGLSAGARIGDAFLRDAGAAWGAAEAVSAPWHRLSLVVAGGTYPLDPAQGFPGGRFASVAIRIAGWTPTVLPRSGSMARGSSDAAAMPGGIALENDRRDDNLRVLRLRGVDAARVEVMGSFSDWTPLAMTRDGAGAWSVALRIPAGVHELRLRVDDGPWAPPPGLPRRADDYDGEVGVLVVP